MKKISSIIIVTTLWTLFFNCNQNTVSNLPITDVPQADYISMKFDYYANSDTLFLVLPKCDCVQDSLIQLISISKFPKTLAKDSLRIQILQIDSLGPNKTISANLYESYVRASVSTGLEGRWVLLKQWIKADSGLSSADSARLMQNFDNARAWLSFSKTQFTMYHYSERVLSFYTVFVKKYGSTIAASDIQIDSLARNSVRLIGNKSLDTVAISQDSIGIVSYAITNKDTLVFKPNPYRYNPASISHNLEYKTCEEYAPWMLIFLNSNPITR